VVWRRIPRLVGRRRRGARAGGVVPAPDLSMAAASGEVRPRACCVVAVRATAHGWLAWRGFPRW
jgi:hypothetical protein